ncbi:hypothetical protein MOMMJLID_CDS0040 [Arthrobacter phage 1191A]|nr:hypothetical protein MOMMJLID_CDS0040 [Arthrobacter phage 1191A]
MSKTFEGVDGTRLLHIKNLGKHVAMSIEVPGQVHMGITFDPASIPALVLAELEAAGWPESDHNSITHSIMTSLGDVIHIQERATAEAKEQAELEAEALDFMNAVRDATGARPLGGFPAYASGIKSHYLIIARKAREMRKS